jgi:periplasmic protein TonB
MSALAINYRVFELPWSAGEEEERRFKRLLGIGLLVFLIVGIAVQLLPVRERAVPPPLPEEVVKLVLQPPPPPPKPVEQKKPEPIPEPVAKPIETPKPLPVPQVDARKKAEKALSAVQDDLKDLREMMDTSQLASAKNLTSNVDGPSRAERSLITSNVAGGSGGINTAQLSQGFGGGPGSLKGHSTQGVGSFADDIKKKGAEARRTGTSNKASRSREEIELVFDRNKAAIYALYSRALRDNPQLQGKVVVQLTIAPTGEVTDCRILSSELGDAELERKLVARIKMFRFDDRDVELITTTKPIDFFPA